MVYCKFTETILKQDDSKKTALLIKDIMPDVRVTKVYCKDEKKLWRSSLQRLAYKGEEKRQLHLSNAQLQI